MRTITVVVPVLDEVDHIEALLDDVAAMRRPELDVDVVVLEGGSTDGTRALLDKLLPHHPHVRVVDNPGGNKARGLNAAIASTQSDLVARLDAHARYPSDYLVALAEAIDRHDADAVGGVRRNAAGAGAVARAIGAVNGSRFGVGNAAYRTGARAPREVDTVFPGFWRRSVFERFGLFDERLTRAQDREFSARLKRGGGRIVLVPGVVIVYFGRDRLKENLGWVADGGEWVFRAAGYAGAQVLGLRNYVPVAFFATLAAGVASIPFVPRLWWLLLAAPLAAYVALALAESAAAAKRHRDARLLPLMPPLYLATHAAYAWGSLKGLAWMLFSSRRHRAAQAEGGRP